MTSEREMEILLDWLTRLEAEAEEERDRAAEASKAEDYCEHELEIARHENEGWYRAVRYIRQATTNKEIR